MTPYLCTVSQKFWDKSVTNHDKLQIMQNDGHMGRRELKATTN